MLPAEEKPVIPEHTIGVEKPKHLIHVACIAGRQIGRNDLDLLLRGHCPCPVRSRQQAEALHQPLAIHAAGDPKGPGMAGGGERRQPHRRLEPGDTFDQHTLPGPCGEDEAGAVAHLHEPRRAGAAGAHQLHHQRPGDGGPSGHGERSSGHPPWQLSLERRSSATRPLGEGTEMLEGGGSPEGEPWPGKQRGFHPFQFF